jgi:hypothetical protein
MKAEHTAAHPEFRETARGTFGTHYIFLVMRKKLRGRNATGNAAKRQIGEVRGPAGWLTQRVVFTFA